MLTPFVKILEKYRRDSFSEADKGSRFEELMREYLWNDPKYSIFFNEIWLWREFPFRKDFGTGHDVGIDLVARTHDGKYWAIQCKCYKEDTYIQKADVDTFITTAMKQFNDENMQPTKFSQLVWIATTDKFSSNAIESFKNLPVKHFIIGLRNLINAPVDWGKLEAGAHGSGIVLNEREPLDHQKDAIAAFHEHFKTAQRGRLIMACGTGKTYTSLKIAEKEVGDDGLVLFLVPSIALLAQTLNEWTTFAAKKIRPMCVCSDAEVSKKQRENDYGGFSVEDLAMPASTDVDTIKQQFCALNFMKKKAPGMRVVFSTYQSLPRVIETQKELNKDVAHSFDFDLIICDEAHRTTGVTLKDDSDSAFVLVHDNDNVFGKKRVYMTATPRLYKDEVKDKAKEADAYLCSMDDVAIYGDEVYRIGFGKAVEQGLLSDYKVLVLTVTNNEIPAAFQKAIATEKGEVRADDVSKLIGCINALSKRTLLDKELVSKTDPGFMHKAVAFCQNIKASKHITDVFNAQKETYYESLTPSERRQVVKIDSCHVDGTMGAAERARHLSWLNDVSSESSDCHILTNVRCLSEGVDVPSLDSVIFLSSRNSQVDVVQSVGRVMRRAPGKKYGYIIIPVIIPEDMSPEEALDKSDAFAVVWTVLNALRAHDDRFNAEINKIDLNKRKSDRIIVDTIPGLDSKRGAGGDVDTDVGSVIESAQREKQRRAVQLEFSMKFTELQSVIYARMVKKVGTRRYWELWAKDVAAIAEKHIERIKRLVLEDGPHKDAFNEFVEGLHKNLNPSVSSEEAVEMLAQHIITQPVFEALFEDYSFVKNNPISVSMQKMIDLLHEEVPTAEMEVMARFYKSIKERCSGIDNAEGKQRVIVELYDKFFKSAFPKVAEKLGIVYTPVECVDFIIRSVEDVLNKEFNRSLSDENVHILDPFTGTGTFMTRLLQSGIIKQKDLPRKYERELHANELVLLAYYIASINIENVYHDLIGEKEKYRSFDGICLTDTFQLAESDDSDKLFSDIFHSNSERVIRQKKAPIRIIIGNPPYSVGQKSANDNAQNQTYPELERHIASKYAAGSKATNKNSLYDSYIKAFRWATDRLEEADEQEKRNGGGIIAFISNAGWIDGNAMDGFRKCLQKEFSSIYVFNLRGNCRTSGEQRRKESGNVFGEGSRTPISITILVRKPKKDPNELANILYKDIGDYLTREDKLKTIRDYSSMLSASIGLSSIVPNEAGDWINQRDGLFDTFIPLGDKDDKTARTVFLPLYSRGIATAKDCWCYNFSSAKLEKNMRLTMSHYMDCLNKDPVYDSTKISWGRSMLQAHDKHRKTEFECSHVCTATYRPFCKQYLYFDRLWNDMVYQIPRLFPTPQSKNLVICVPGVGTKKGFMPFIVDTIPDVQLQFNGQCFPLYYYEKNERDALSLFDNSEDEYLRRDAITNFILQRARQEYGPRTTKEDIFYYVYGILHAKEYRERFASDLQKSLPRLPLVEDTKTFKAFVSVGKKLAALHLNYENVEPHPSVIVENDSVAPIVQQMRFGKTNGEEDRSIIHYNDSIKIINIPLRAYDWHVNGKSPLEWLMERYAVSINKDSHIRNDPNEWCKENQQPRYILELIGRIVNVSIQTLDLIASLPPISFKNVAD